MLFFRILISMKKISKPKLMRPSWSPWNATPKSWIFFWVPKAVWWIWKQFPTVKRFFICFATIIALIYHIQRYIQNFWLLFKFIVWKKRHLCLKKAQILENLRVTWRNFSNWSSDCKVSDENIFAFFHCLLTLKIYFKAFHWKAEDTNFWIFKNFFLLFFMPYWFLVFFGKIFCVKNCILIIFFQNLVLHCFLAKFLKLRGKS